MLQRPILHSQWRSLLPLVVILPLTALVVSGCGSGGRDRVAATAEPEAFPVRIEPGRNGAALSSEEEAEREKRMMPRALAFKVTGAAPRPEGDVPAEQRIAASQAAVIDAFCRALIEARQARGQPTENFTARLGPRMTVVHRRQDDSVEIRIKILYLGIENTLAVRNGVLQHPPVDLRLIHRLFEETNGEFSLLSTHNTIDDERVTATVACYLPAGFDPTAKVNIARTDEEMP